MRREIVGDGLQLHCGSICIDSKVLWQRGNAFGIEFASPIGHDQLAEQISRAEAIAHWRRARALVRSKVDTESLAPWTIGAPSSFSDEGA